MGVVPRTPEAEEEDTILESYLKEMKIKEGQLTLPPVCERPDGFDLFYQRRSRRRIYDYEVDDEKFTLLISKYQEKTVDAAETEASDFDEIDTEVLFLFKNGFYSQNLLWNLLALVCEISKNSK